ncbi:AIPR family protein [Limnofasciculus baicalensis]|uniref:AIPR family protein n=1 Tax=Limnofasciculus baicalensis BBK-W-15 TaxID=2699891 RepID=A0AAE3GQI2_9CYAN|nr:AIPR family protein [Limnofasciculus baicalensis]MCP2727983.1 AIPR family protein [Limnofasciculus baicalensis BBK-W-15]
MQESELDYSNLSSLLLPYTKKKRSISRSFLNWFLENIFGMDDTSADDVICDGHQDKGIDALYVDELNEEIIVFQSKTVESANKTIGDTSLKEFAGTLNQLSTLENIKLIEKGNANEMLKKLVADLKLKTKIENGFIVKGVFITNASADQNAEEYLASNESIKLFDKKKIVEVHIDFEKQGGVNDEFVFDCSHVTPLNFSTLDKIAEVWVFTAFASDLVKMSGIEDASLFQQNVRLALGSTKVNKAIKKSILDPNEHVKFQLYHNGITIICDFAKHENDKITIGKYVVVNGAQSISTLYNQRKNITENLKILTKIIKLNTDDVGLVKKITTNSNNQNAIKPRDLQSNQTIQQRLKKEFESIDGYEFAVKRGERLGEGKVISNEDAGRMLLTFDLNEPWNSHQKSQIFDEYYSKIFGRPAVNAKRIILTYEILCVVEQTLDQIDHKQYAYYSATKYFLLYVISKIMQDDDVGKAIYTNKLNIVSNSNDISEFKRIIADILSSNIIVDLNYFLKDENNAAFDYKKVSKNTTQLQSLSMELLKDYEKDLKRGKARSISEQWKVYKRGSS